MSNASEDGVAPSKVGVAELEVSQQRDEAEIRQLEKGSIAAAERAVLDACAELVLIPEKGGRVRLRSEQQLERVAGAEWARRQLMLENEARRSRTPSRPPVYRHLWWMLFLIGLGNIAIRAAHPIVGALLLVGSAIFLVLAVRSVVARLERN